MLHPLFSIITVTYNAAEPCAPTLQSVKAQTCRLFEYIVIDGASSDSTVKMAEDAGIENIKIISEPDNGLYDAMNKGLGLATGDYVIFLNAGDSFHTHNTLQHIADAIFNNDYPGIVYGQTVIVDMARNRLRDRHFTAPANLDLSSFSNGMTVCHQAFIALRKITNTYDTRYRFSADYEWCIRCLQRSHRNCYLDEVLIDYLEEGVTTRHWFR
ncbi:MAG: glycosyltransferase, partial [Duncaniella sp.]|nr:glycosyltransferase [Duncaniella sp.]